MARCRCGADESLCGCILAAGDGIAIAGTGTTTSPWIVSTVPQSTGTIQFVDTPVLEWAVTGIGVQGSPYMVSAAVDIDPLVTVLDSVSVRWDRVGAGTILDPLELTAHAEIGSTLQFANTPEVNLVVSGAGNELTPMVVSAELPWVTVGGGTPGDVLTLQIDGTYLPAPPNTVAPGSVFVAGGLTGDGSGGNPIRVNICTYDDLEAVCASP